MVKNLFVGNLAYSVTDEILEQLFATIGTVQTAKVIKDRYSGTSRGFGFVEMVSEEDARKAIEKLNEHSLEGRNIFVKEAQPKPAYSSDRNGGGRNDRSGGGSGGYGGGFRTNRY